MLSFVPVRSPNEIKKIIDQFSFEESTWIVADLKSKTDLQIKCINRFGYYLDDSILRISDFWQIALRRLLPHLKIVSESFIEFVLEDFLNTQIGQNLIQHMDLQPHQYYTIFKYMSELAPIILSPDSDEILKEWSQSKTPDWYSWYLISRLCLKYLITERKIILASWSSGLLQSQKIESIGWNRTLYIDLGSEMTSLEMGLFQQLSKVININIIVPDPSWKNKYQYILQSYQAQNIPLADSKDRDTKKNCVYRFNTEALEIKYIVHQVKQWIDLGISLKNILIASPRIEDYWPILKIHLDFERIAYNKKNTVSAISTGFFQKVIAYMNSQSSSVDWENLEQSYFSQNEVNYDFENFKMIFFEMIDENDLLPIDEIKNAYFKKINLQNSLTRTDYLFIVFKVISKFLQTESSESLQHTQNVIQSVFKDFINLTTDAQFKIQSWNKILLNTLKRSEISTQLVLANGLEVSNTQNLMIYEITHVIWFGLDESGFKKSSTQFVPISDVEDLKTKFDFPINFPDESHIEFNLRWLSEYSFVDSIMTCSQFSFQADPLISANLILEIDTHPVPYENKLTAQQSYLDYLQKNISNLSDLKKYKKFNDEITGSKRHKIPEFTFTDFSVSEIIKFDQCSFKLLASKGFRLKDLATHGLDLDPRQSGSIYHALFEQLLKLGFSNIVELSEIETFLDNYRTKNKLYLRKDVFWNVEKKKLLEVALKFYEFEKQRLSPRLQQHLVEKDFKIKFDVIAVSGRIDRIDIYDKNQAIVFDYKRSQTSDVLNSHLWIEEKQFQMLFYLIALKEQLNFIPAGALYYTYKNMKINKGMLLEHFTDEYLANNISKKAIASDEMLVELLIQFKSKVAEIEKKIQNAQFSPIPFKLEICTDCEWKNLCRAPHL